MKAHMKHMFNHTTRRNVLARVTLRRNQILTGTPSKPREDRSSEARYRTASSPTGWEPETKAAKLGGLAFTCGSRGRQ